MAHIAERMALIGQETAFEVLAKAQAMERQGRRVVHLEIGEPDFDTPEHIRLAAWEALQRGETHYGPGPGIPALRELIAQKAGELRGLDFHANQVVVTPGAKPIMFFTIIALVNEGDEVVYPNPSFPIYESMINFVGGKPVPLPLREEYGFRFDHDELRRLVNPKTKLIILNSPHNPTGGVLTRDDLDLVARLAIENDALVLTDEVYAQMIYEGEHVSIASLPEMKDRSIVLDGFSKTFAMTGWRLGYGIFPEMLVPPIAKLISNSVSCTASFVQHAGIAALTGPMEPVRTMVAEFHRRRQVIVDGLNAIEGLHCELPAGAFYAFPSLREVPMTSREFADFLLRDFGVAALSGNAFGEYGDGFLRLSYANSLENIHYALEQIAAATDRVRAENAA